MLRHSTNDYENWIPSETIHCWGKGLRVLCKPKPPYLYAQRRFAQDVVFAPHNYAGKVVDVSIKARYGSLMLP